MARQRGELLPIGEVIADLPGPIQALIGVTSRNGNNRTLSDSPPWEASGWSKP